MIWCLMLVLLVVIGLMSISVSGLVLFVMCDECCFGYWCCV